MSKYNEENLKMMKNKKEYLGDAVYVEIERGMVKLTAENGISALNTIYLDIYVLQAFKEWLARMEDRRSE